MTGPTCGVHDGVAFLISNGRVGEPGRAACFGRLVRPVPGELVTSGASCASGRRPARWRRRLRSPRRGRPRPRIRRRQRPGKPPGAVRRRPGRRLRGSTPAIGRPASSTASATVRGPWPPGTGRMRRLRSPAPRTPDPSSERPGPRGDPLPMRGHAGRLAAVDGRRGRVVLVGVVGGLCCHDGLRDRSAAFYRCHCQPSCPFAVSTERSTATTVPYTTQCSSCPATPMSTSPPVNG